MLLETKPKIAVWTEDGRDDVAADVGIDIAIDGTISVTIDALNNSKLTYIALRWNANILQPGSKILGDHWERGYGDLEWRGAVAE